MEKTHTDHAANPPVNAAPDAEFPFAIRDLRLPAGRIRYVDEGRGDTLLFVHGTPTWSFEWRHLIRALSPNYRCVAPDHLGFGFSERPENSVYTPEAHAENLLALVKALDLTDITLIVHDFGGPIGLQLFHAEPQRIRRVVILNSWMWGFSGDKAMARTARIAGGPIGKFLYRRANFSLRVLLPSAYGKRGKLTAAIHKRYLDRFPDPDSRGLVLWALARSLLASEEFFEGLWKRRDDLARIPVLIIWGLRDRAFPPGFLERWRSALPDAEIMALPDAGHWPHEEEPDAVAARLAEFLARK